MLYSNGGYLAAGAGDNEAEPSNFDLVRPTFGRISTPLCQDIIATTNIVDSYRLVSLKSTRERVIDARATLAHARVSKGRFA